MNQTLIPYMFFSRCGFEIILFWPLSDKRRLRWKVEQNQCSIWERFLNPYVRIQIPFVLRRASTSALEDGAKKQVLFCRDTGAADQIDASLIACASSLFSCCSSPGGNRFLQLNRNHQKMALVRGFSSFWFSLQPYSFWALKHSPTWGAGWQGSL